MMALAIEFASAVKFWVWYFGHWLVWLLMSLAIIGIGLVGVFAKISQSKRHLATPFHPNFMRWVF